MVRAKFIKSARKDYPSFGIKKGDGYYMWSFRFGPTYKSLIAPRRSQLTRSGFLSSLYDLEDEINAASGIDEGQVEDWKSTLESMKEECESSLENMPDGLRESSSSGELLQERIDGLESWIADLENIDFDIDTETLRAEAEEEFEGNEENKADEVEDAYEQKVADRQSDIDSEVQNAAPGLS